MHHALHVLDASAVSFLIFIFLVQSLSTISDPLWQELETTGQEQEKFQMEYKFFRPTATVLVSITDQFLCAGYQYITTCASFTSACLRVCVSLHLLFLSVSFPYTSSPLFYSTAHRLSALNLEKIAD